MEEKIQEITNAVLAEQIKGLTKITDERFLTIKEALNRIEQHNLGFATKVELEETKKDFFSSIRRIEEGFVKHNEDDKQSFGGLDKGQRELRDTIKTWGGVIAVLAFVLPIIVPVVMRYVLKW